MTQIKAHPTLYTAEPCDDSDPAQGIRLNRAGVRLNRLSPDEARSLAADLLTAIGEPQMVAIRADDAVLLLKVCALYAPHLRDGQLTPDVREVVERVGEATS